MVQLEDIMPNVNTWLNSPVIDEQTKASIRSLLASDDKKELINSFYRNLEFGTGGLRGIMGAGSNCMNKYTVGIATQGFANYFKKSLPNQQISIAIAHDSRNNSRFFAEITANIFSANGITVHLFSELRPTPLLSFAIRHLHCHGGIVITASHNPKEYNGYKAYWADGGQLVPPHDKNVIEEVNKITDFSQVKFDPDKSLIKTISAEVEEAYYDEVKRLIPGQDAILRQKNISLVYSSIHGAGITMVPECLKRLGFTNLQVVEEQAIPDGNFPTVQSPNPEEKSAMELALKKASAINADLVMATDPDTDRVGIGIKNEKGEFFLLNGNQALSMMMWFILKNLKEKKDRYIAKTIVTTELIDTMAAAFGVECYNTLTGFKYIGELIRELENKKTFVSAGEESYGYMVGDFVRDKDAVSACAFFAAMAATAKDEGKSLYEYLISVYVQYGFYKEGLTNVVKKGAEGEQQIKTMMEKFRSNPPASIAGKNVVRSIDYKLDLEKDLLTGKTKSTGQPTSDVLQFYTEDGSKISVRPSGTEPKIKFYISVKSRLDTALSFHAVNKQLDEKIREIEQDFNKY